MYYSTWDRRWHFSPSPKKLRHAPFNLANDPCYSEDIQKLIDIHQLEKMLRLVAHRLHISYGPYILRDVCGYFVTKNPKQGIDQKIYSILETKKWTWHCHSNLIKIIKTGCTTFCVADKKTKKGVPDTKRRYLLKLKGLKSAA